eukprot:5786362-Amphidinium_carterae.1
MLLACCISVEVATIYLCTHAQRARLTSHTVVLKLQKQQRAIIYTDKISIDSVTSLDSGTRRNMNRSCHTVQGGLSKLAEQADRPAEV